MDMENVRAIAGILKRCGWPETSLLVEGGREIEPDLETMIQVLDYFYCLHRDHPRVAATALGCREFPDRKIFIVLYRLEGWERDRQEHYDCISLAGGFLDVVEEGKFLRRVGAEFAPTEENLARLARLHDLCTRRAGKYYFNLVPEEQKLLDEYLEVATRRHPPEKESEFFQNQIGHCLSSRVAEDLFRLAYYLGRTELIEEEWERTRELPPELYRDELFLKFYAKCGDSAACGRILDDLWRRTEPWALYRLIDRIKKGFPMAEPDEKQRCVEARLLALGQRIMGEWNREELRRVLELSESHLPESLFAEPCALPARRARG